MTTPTTLRRCPGVPSMGRPDHEAPLAEFASNKGRPDGLSRLCKACSKAYAAFRAGKAQVEQVLGPISEPLSDPAVTEAIEGAKQRQAERRAALRAPRRDPVKRGLEIVAAMPHHLTQPLDANGETVGVAERRARFELAVEVATPDEREALLASRGAEQVRLVAQLDARIDALLAKRAKARDAKRRQRARAKASAA